MACRNFWQKPEMSFLGMISKFNFRSPVRNIFTCFRCSQLHRNCVKITAVCRFVGGASADQKKTQMIFLNCGVTHSPGKIEYNCGYFIMTFRKQIGEYKFGKNCFHTLQSTMSHRPLTNSSSLKITAAYWAIGAVVH